MKLTNEQIQQILDGAPEGEQYINIPVAGGLTHKAHRIDDLREILTLRQEVEWLKSQQSEVAARAVEEILNWDHSYIQTEEGRFAYYDDAIESYANQLREQGNV